MTIPTGRLPLEDAHHEWNAGLEADFSKAREPFDILRDIAMAPGVTFRGNKPFDDATAWTLLSVVTKILKAYRGMLILCEAGHGHEAVVLLRVVLEASAQILWICRSDDPRDAVRQAGAYEQKRLHLVLTEADLVEEAAKTAETLDAILATIPHVTRDTIKFHYSGLRNFEQLCRQLGWMEHYLWIYRIASAPAHSTDVTDHISGNSDGEPVLALAPGCKLVRECLAAGPIVLNEVLDSLRTTYGFEPQSHS